MTKDPWAKMKTKAFRVWLITVDAILRTKNLKLYEEAIKSVKDEWAQQGCEWKSEDCEFLTIYGKETANATPLIQMRGDRGSIYTIAVRSPEL